MRKRTLKALLAGLAVLGGLFALPASPVEAAECDITVTIQADIPLSLDVSDPTKPVFKGCGEVMPKSQFNDTKQVVSVTVPDILTIQTPSGEMEAPEGTKIELIGSINARQGYHNYCLEYTLPEYMIKDQLSVEIPVTSDLIANGVGEYSVSVPVTFTSSVQYGSYSYSYDFTPWADLITNGDITVSSAKLSNVKSGGFVLDPDPSISSIGSNAFKNANYHEVIIPSSVTSAANAFNGSNTRIVTFDKGMVTVPASICAGATSLEIASLGIDVKNIGSHAFDGCTSLYLVSGMILKDLGANCFKNCTSLEEFTIYTDMTSSVSMQSSSPFYGAGIKKVYVSNGTTTVPSYMFCNCPNLSYVDLPPTLKTIGNYSFLGVPNLKEITIRSNISRTSTSTTSGCFSNTGLTKITFEDGVTSVPRYMFTDGCANVTELNLPDTITTIDSSAFSGCSSLTELNLPANIAVLGGDAFKNAKSLKEIHIYNNITLPRSCVVSPFEGSGLEKIVIEEGVTTVVSYLFNRGCNNLTDLTLPSTIRSIEGNSFGNAVSLKTVTIPANVMISYGGVVSPFNGSGLEEIIFSEGVTSINSSLFKDGCSHVTRIVFPSTLTTIGYDAFSGCASLSEVNLPSSVTSIGLGAFENSTKLISFTVNSSWAKPSGADMSPFDGSALTDIYVRSGITTLGAMHLANNSDTEMILHLPVSITSINTNTFLKGEKYSVIYDGTEAQYAAITKGEGFSPISVQCADTILNSSLMAVTEEETDDPDDLFSGLLDEPEEEDPEVPELTEEDPEEEITEPAEPIVLPENPTEPEEINESIPFAGEESYADPVEEETLENPEYLAGGDTEGAEEIVENTDSGTAIPEIPLESEEPAPEEVSTDG